MHLLIFGDFLKHITHQKYFFAHNFQVIDFFLMIFLSAIELNTAPISYEFYSIIFISVASSPNSSWKSNPFSSL